MQTGGSTTAPADEADETAAVVIFEDEYREYSGVKSSQPFIVVPHNLAPAECEIEATMPLKSLSELLDFEKNNTMEESEQEEPAASPSALVWKERGDALLRLHDHDAAAVCYEKALRRTSRIEIGATVLVKAASGHVVAAEIDCIDGADVDVSFVQTGGEEATVPKSKILLAVAEQEGADPLQQRILLNLSRCMLQLAETSGVRSRRPQYLRAAVLSTSLVLALCPSTRESADNTAAASSTSLQMSALLLRGKAQAGLQKFQHAEADLKRLLALDPEHKEGLSQIKLLQRQKAKVAKTNKRLAKDVSQWVQTVMHDKEQQEGEAPSVSDADEPKRQNVSLSRKWEHANAILFWLSLITVALFAWFAQKYFG